MTGPVPGIDNVYAHSEEFFDQYFAHVFARPLAINWCLDWHKHLEAREVMEALWKSWEIANVRAQIEGMAVWFRDYAYPLLDRLIADKGTFDGCDWKERRHDPATVVLHRET